MKQQREVLVMHVRKFDAKYMIGTKIQRCLPGTCLTTWKKDEGWKGIYG